MTLNPWKRIRELEAAIVAANDGVSIGEGVSLLYYMEYETEATRRTIAQVLRSNPTTVSSYAPGVFNDA